MTSCVVCYTAVFRVVTQCSSLCDDTKNGCVADYVMCKPTINECLACVASVSVWFGSKERPRNRILGFGRARNETPAKKWKWGEGEGKERNACRQTPRFWKPAFASESSAWLARLVEQCWHVSIKGLFHLFERSCLVRDTHINFLWLLFILVGKICPPMQEHFI